MIKRVHISNFKCLGNVTVDLDPVTVLIGRSGTGKTTFVEALRFVRDYVALHGENALQLYGGSAVLMSATPKTPLTVSFRITFTVPGVQEDYEYTLQFAQPPELQRFAHPRTVEPTLNEEKLSLGTRTLFHRKAGNWVVQPKTLQELRSPPP